MQQPPPWATAATANATIHNRASQSASSATMQPRPGHHSSGQSHSGGGVDYQRQQEQQNDDQLAQLRNKVSALRNVRAFFCSRLRNTEAQSFPLPQVSIQIGNEVQDQNRFLGGMVRRAVVRFLLAIYHQSAFFHAFNILCRTASSSKRAACWAGP